MSKPVMEVTQPLSAALHPVRADTKTVGEGEGGLWINRSRIGAVLHNVSNFLIDEAICESAMLFA